MSALYDQIGTTYARYRRADPRIAAAIEAALEGCVAVLSVGAGSGSYEPGDAAVIAVEPSLVMIGQRSLDAAPVVQGVAGHLPFVDGMFDAAIAILTVHHWPDAQRGLDEMRRVASRQVVLTWDPVAASRYWLITDYLPEMATHESRLTTCESIASMLGTDDVRVVRVPHDCTDGFMAAYWRRPELYLDPDARAAISGVTLLDEAIVARGMRALAADFESGAWHRRHAELMSLEEIDAGYRLVVASG